MANPTPFTPEEVAQILEAFFAAVGTRQYIGARYVPIFGRKGEESIVWDNSAPYEPLTIVLYQGNSFTSRQYVPAGVEITNEEFWAETGNYNAQIEQYRLEVVSVREDLTDGLAQTDIYQCVDHYGADPTGTNDSSSAIAQCIEANPGKTILFNSGTYRISQPIVVPFEHSERVSIDFRGATILPVGTMPCILYLGGDMESGALPRDTPTNQVKTFYSNGVFVSNGVETAILVKSGLRSDTQRYVTYTNATVEGCNLYGFYTPIVIGEYAGESPADIHITNCLIRRNFQLGTKGIVAKSTDINIDNCRIYGYQYAIYSDESSGIVMDAVHNLDNGASTADEIEAMAFLYSNESGGGYVLTNCYCDACGTFVKFKSSERLTRYVLSMENSIFYSPGGIAHDMCVLDMSEIAQTNLNAGEVHLVLTGNQFYFTTTRVSGVPSDVGIKLPENANMQLMLINGLIKLSNNVVRAENLAPGDLLLNAPCLNTYFGTTEFSDKWLPIARIPIALNAVSTALIRVQMPLTGCDSYDLYMTYQANATLNALNEMDVTLARCNLKCNAINTISQTVTFGVSLEKAKCNAYELVVYMQSSVSVNTSFSVKALMNASNLLLSPISMIQHNAAASAFLETITPQFTVQPSA